jgi:hypothetical protein
MHTSIVVMGCPQPSRLAPERAPLVEELGHVQLDDPGCAYPAVVDLLQGGVAATTGPETV